MGSFAAEKGSWMAKGKKKNKEKGMQTHAENLFSQGNGEEFTD